MIIRLDCFLLPPGEVLMRRCCYGALFSVGLVCFSRLGCSSLPRGEQDAAVEMTRGIELSANVKRNLETEPFFSRPPASCFFVCARTDLWLVLVLFLRSR